MIVSIKDIKANKTNPRNIAPEKLEKLKKSISDFPDMLNKRPLVCFTDKDGKYVVLGGNMRLKACKELGIKELPIILADEWTEEQKNEFIIKDNVGFGDWDWGVLQTDWDLQSLEQWGLEVGIGMDEMETSDEFNLADGDKDPFQQQTYTLADQQAEEIKNAISNIKNTQDFKYVETFGNENSNGNALYLIIMQWAEQRK